MANRADAATSRPAYRLNGIAQVMERIGLAIMGRGYADFFVAALVAKANIEEINTLGVLFSVIMFGSIGFYVGTNIPSLSSGASHRGFFPTPHRAGRQPRSRWQAPPAHSSRLLRRSYRFFFDHL